MGATLPPCPYATQRLGAAGNRVGTLYGVNTFGAVIGTWLCGFFCFQRWVFSGTHGFVHWRILCWGLAQYVSMHGYQTPHYRQ